jgi:hypothetical protein
MICPAIPAGPATSASERVGEKGDAPFGDNGASHHATGLWGDAQPSHIVVTLVVTDVTDVQNHWDFTEVLPPVRRALGFGADLAGLVMDGSGAITGVFDNLALLDEDKGGPVVMAVPRDYAARLDHELAESQLAAGNFRHLFAEVDRAERGVGYADSLEIDRLARIRHALVRGTFTRLGVKREAGHGDEGRGSESAKQAFAF